jgi:hypothetical protein
MINLKTYVFILATCVPMLIRPWDPSPANPTLQTGYVLTAACLASVAVHFMPLHQVLNARHTTKCRQTNGQFTRGDWMNNLCYERYCKLGTLMGITAFSAYSIAALWRN